MPVIFAGTLPMKSIYVVANASIMDILQGPVRPINGAFF